MIPRTLPSALWTFLQSEERGIGLIIIKSEQEIEKMKVAGAITASVFAAVAPHIVPGISTKQLDEIVYETIVSQGAVPSFLNYGDPPFPGSACISINEEVVHGIPSATRFLRDGDIVSVDVGAYIDGYHGDACRTFLCGEVSQELKDLVRVTEESFWIGVAKAVPGNRLGDISAAVQEHCEKHGYGIVRELTGHGIGRNLHEAPDLLNYGKAGHGVRLKPGMCLALEPMVTLGHYSIDVLDDEWTIVTRDGKAAAHYENTFAITEDGPVILTCPERTRP